MERDNIGDLLIFLAVARERSFTRAAATLGASKPVSSRTVRNLEARLGVRLLTRTTRSVASNEAGERVMQTVAPRLAEIESELSAVSEMGEMARGTVRITAVDYAIDTVLWPRLSPLLREHPQIKVEITIDYGLSDIVKDRFDIGVRWGDQVAKDMIAARIAPDMRSVIVAAPSYLQRYRPPQDLTNHNCITLRLATGGIYAWGTEQG